LTVEEGQDQRSDWGTTVDTVLSGDTLTVIKSDPLPQRGRKRQRVEAEAGPSNLGDLRDRYPIETKKPYLTCKTLHKKKLSLAFTIARVEEDLNNGRSPQETRLSHKIPGRIAHHPGLKIQWDQVLNESSNKLAHLYMDKLKEDYIDLKRKITEKMDSMKDALEPSQFTEIQEALASNYKKAASNTPGARYRNKQRPQIRQQGRRLGQAPARRPFKQNQDQPRDQRSQLFQRRDAPIRGPRRNNPVPMNNNDLVGQIMALINSKYQQ
jgi:hypothetical protein